MSFKIPVSTLYMSMILFIACAGRNNVESQVSVSPTIRHISGACEDCELMFAGMPTKLSPADTSDGWYEPGQKLIVSGKIYSPDKRSPAADIILYYYHTDQKGIYAPDKKNDGIAQRHGRLRGWVRTGADGSYSIFTSRPAQYPNNNIEAHIHLLIKEPDIDKPYWIDEWVFDDDPLLTPDLRRRFEKRGGSGILNIAYDGAIQVATHDIFLGLNIPGYPMK